MSSRTTVTWGLRLILAIGIGILLATGIHSGLFFQLDQDELVHAQFSYLLLHGYVPYRQFLMTYTPIFHWAISPVFLLAGYTLDVMSFVRWFMVALFILRIAVSGWLILRVFGKAIAALFMLLFLIDPFTMYTSMQVRPDNLMMLLFTAGLAILFLAFAKRKSAYFFWSGMLLATSSVVLFKIIPSLLVVWAAVLWYGYTRRRFSSVQIFTIGFALPICIFFIYTANLGTTTAMLQQVIQDSFAINKSLAFPVPIKHFFQLNPALFDVYGAAWKRFPFFELGMFAVATIGLIHMIVTLRADNRKSHVEISLMQLILVGSLVAQAVGLFFVRSMFIQYFLPITWLVDVVVSVAIVRWLQIASRRKTFFIIALIEVIIVLTLFSYDSAQANITRSHSDTNVTIAWLRTVSAQIPPNSAVYPNIPFHPLAYPLVFGYYFHDLPYSITSTLPPLVPTLEKNHVPYILETYEWKALPQGFVWYVANQYHKVYPGIYVRNE